MAVEVDADHRAPLGERREVRPEHFDLAEPAVEEEQRLALTVDRIVVVDAVGRHVAGRLGGDGCLHRLGSFFCGVGRRGERGGGEEGE